MCRVDMAARLGILGEAPGPVAGAAHADHRAGRAGAGDAGPDRITGPSLLSPGDGNGAPLYALTGSQDGTADLWNPVNGTLVESLIGTAGAVTPAAERDATGGIPGDVAVGVGVDKVLGRAGEQTQALAELLDVVDARDLK